MNRRSFALLSLLAFAPPASAAKPKVAPPQPPPPVETAVARILSEALASDDAARGLEELCDKIGNRLSGTPALDAAIKWATARMRAEGFDNVRAEPVMVPVWRRGVEHAKLLAPVDKSLSILGLGGSAGTPPEGITAEAVVVSSFEELTALGEAGVRGRIVVFDVPFTSYGETVRYRGGGASAAAKLGAVAVLVRTVGPLSYDTPHTGALGYAEGVPKIPAASLSIEDAAMLHRLARRGDSIKIALAMGAEMLPDAPSANVVGEVRGRDRADEIIVVGGHLDSWDVGQGAQDDGVGVIEAMEAAHLLARLGLHPRRTIRVVLFTNEENGTRGAKGYREAHLAELQKHVAAIESDSGGGPVGGFTFEVHAKGPVPVPPWAEPKLDAAGEAAHKKLVEATQARLAPLMHWLDPVEASALKPGHAGTDVGPILWDGVLGIGVDHDTTHYWDVHHSRADTFDKVDLRQLRRSVAALAVLLYLLGEVY